MKKGISDQIVVARRGGRIVGYGMFSAGEGNLWYSPGERFGPFGVENSERSKGAGSAILARLMNNMKGLGIRHAYFLWTDERASHLYKRFGFRITREFTILEKDLR
jgi:N-acetylglutamate synthase-like GNAT family acetyltransferase